MTNPSFPIASFGLDDVRIKNAISTIYRAEGTPVNTNFQDLIDGTRTVVPYATCEPNEWLLDGTYHFMPPAPDNGYYTAVLSDVSGNVGVGASGANMIITFAAQQSLTSFTIFFDVNTGDYCSQINVQFLDHTGSVVLNTTVNPMGTSYTITASLPDVLNIFIYNQVTSKPYRFVRISRIMFNSFIDLDKTKISYGTITEHYSPINATLQANTLELDLLLDDSEFSVVNPNALYSSLPENMPFTVWEIVDNVANLMGVFYLDTWENPSPSSHVVKFHLYDAIGFAAKLPFYGWAEGGAVGVYNLITILNYIFSSNGMTYAVNDPASILATYNIYGCVAPVSVRDAIQQLAMANRLSVNTSGAMQTVISPKPATNLPIYMGDGSQDYSIAISQEQIEQVDLQPLITGIKYIYNPKQAVFGTATILYSQNLATGNYVIAFSQPQSSLSITGAAFSTPANWNDWGAWFALFTVSTAGKVVITGKGAMVDTTQPATVNLPIGAGGTLSKYIEVDVTAQNSAGLPGNGRQGQAQWLADYYSQRYYQKSMVYGIQCHAGDLVKIDSQEGKHILGNIESAVINLVGLRTEIEVIGILL